MSRQPRGNWPKLLKEFLIESFETKLNEILDNRQSFVDLVKEQFKGTALTVTLLNSYICLWRKGRLKISENKKFNRCAFHKESFLKMLAKEANKIDEQIQN